ncbi:uncharacterized protein LODBEIA_P10390 [Lodderomyces beijingensis]|uniref:Serine/threonine-protein phosphatase 2A activator n=1 Tax=Lodderomyces beijingensis TaxID=1775926 RepID=A0ABP0ZI41_9ASCO
MSMSMSNPSEPSKKIFDSSDLAIFEKTIAFHNLQQSLQEIVLLVQGKEVPPNTLDISLITRSKDPKSQHEIQQPPPPPPSSPPPSLPLQQQADTSSLDQHSGHPSPIVVKILSILHRLNKLIDECPPVQGPTRFGNVAFRTWHEKAHPIISSSVSQIPTSSPEITIETNYYLANAFGSAMRLDYGTGHELSFFAFLAGLMRSNIIHPTGEELLMMFARYYDLARRLITVYNLEPAGSHGVWGLDDHFHLIYILGASQFCDDPTGQVPSVRTALSSSNLTMYKSSNLYTNAVAFIFKLKSGPFHEHSPVISDIHANVLSWKKVRQGLMKMYMVEVFGKFPVIQHFWFGQVLYPWRDARTKEPLPVHQRDEVDSGDVKRSSKPMPSTRAPWANASVRDSTFTQRR